MSKDAKFVVRLTGQERAELQNIVDEGKHSKSVRQRARVLLKVDQADEGPAWTDARAAEFAEVSPPTVHRVRKRLVTEGFEAAVFRKPSTDRLYRKLDGEAEARLIAEACSEAPEGQSRWTLRLLADCLVALEVVDSISVSTVQPPMPRPSYPGPRNTPIRNCRMGGQAKQ